MSRPIRTLLFSTLYPSSVRPSHGIFVETRLRELLKSGRVETRVVAPVPWFPSKAARWGHYATFAKTPAREHRNGVDVLHPRYPLLPKVGMTTAPLLLALGALPAVRQVMSEGFDFDVIDAHYFYPDGVAAALLARWFGKPLTITARGSDLTLIPHHRLPRAMIEWAARSADASIAVCSALLDVLRRWDLPEKKLFVIRNGVDLQRFRPLDRLVSRQVLGITGSPVLVSVGALRELKGHHLTIEAMPAVLARHPNAQLLLVGEGEEKSRLAQLIGRLGLADHVKLVGAQPNESLVNWYSAADLSILASSSEGWANVLLESMACGTPVMATRVWGTPEVVAHPDAGRLVDQRNAESIAEGLLATLAELPSRTRVRAYAEQFSWDQTTSAQLDLFGQLSAGAA